MRAIVSERLAEALARRRPTRAAPVIPLDVSRHEASSRPLGQGGRLCGPWTLILSELLCRRKRASLRVGPLERPLRARP